MGGRHRRAHPGGEVQPKGAGEQRCGHQPDKGLGVAHQFGVDDAGFNGADHIAAGNQRAGGFADRREHNGAGKRYSARANRRADIVGNVVGAYVHRHIAPDQAREQQQAGMSGIRRRNSGENKNHT